LHLHHGEVTDSSNLCHIINKIKPDEIYNLAAQSHVKVSFEVPEMTAEASGFSTLKILEAIRSSGLEETCKFYQASTSEMYGLVQEVPQSETTPFYPRSPYGVAKLYGYWIVKNYRESYNMFASNGILFNHESPRRGITFVTRKITIGVSKIYKGSTTPITLGNIDAKRDWGHAKDYVKIMWQILQHNKPDDWVMATGEQHTVREFIEKCFRYIDVDVEWKGEAEKEIGYDKADPTRILVKIDKKYYRPAEVESLLGDPTKARTQLGVKMEYSFDDLVNDMMKHELVTTDYF
jgi:GDPmannose 4,6-dehydratase